MKLFPSSATFQEFNDLHYWVDAMFLDDFCWILLRVLAVMVAMYHDILPHQDPTHRFSIHFHRNMSYLTMQELQKKKCHFMWKFGWLLIDPFRLSSFLFLFLVFRYPFSYGKFGCFWRSEDVHPFCCCFPTHWTIFGVNHKVCPCPSILMINFEFFQITRSKPPYFLFHLLFWIQVIFLLPIIAWEMPCLDLFSLHTRKFIDCFWVFFHLLTHSLPPNIFSPIQYTVFSVF